MPLGMCTKVPRAPETSRSTAFTLTVPRMDLPMARAGVFVSGLGRIPPRFGTPAIAVVAQAAWAVALALTGTFAQLLTYVVFTGWIFYGLGALSVFVYRARSPDAPRPYRTPGYPLTPALFALSAAVLVGNTLMTQPARAGVGIVSVLTGVPVYLFWRRSPPTAASRG